ncbi:MAG TPA: class I SAM-dependent methyltransferase, partial [Chthoniobacterales bacterium]|nr:class I SAM-dependent methyltransferase [Chthoniobacterales bacterium]
MKTPAPASETEPYAGIEVLTALEAACHYNAMILRLIERHAGHARRLLDFGAGLGTFARLLRARNRAVICVEQDRALLRRLQGDGFETHAGLADVADASVEFAFSLNVLEHLPNDGRTLAELATKVIPGGTIFVYVPAFSWLWTSLDRRLGHMRRYTRSSLVMTAQARDLEVIASGYADSFGIVAVIL